jgi:hypothetical protein
MKEALKLALDWYDSGVEHRDEFQVMIESILAQPEQPAQEPATRRSTPMNERDIELAEQATEIVDMVGPHGYASSYANFDREKFADLIRADEREAVEDLLKEYDMVNSAFAKDFRARGNT